MNPREMYFSNHWVKDRKERLEQIDYVLRTDWGIVIGKAWDTERNSWQYMTDTGLLFIMDEFEQFIITMYIPSKSHFLRFFKMMGQEPSEQLVKRAKRNYYRARAWEEKLLEKVA